MENLYLAQLLGGKKWFLDGGVGTMPKVLEAYIDEATWLALHIQGGTTWPSQVGA